MLEGGYYSYYTKAMLTKEDLHQIGELMDERTETVLVAVKNGFDETSERLDGVETRLGSVEGKMVTKEDFDRKLGLSETRMMERFDRRYTSNQ